MKVTEGNCGITKLDHDGMVFTIFDDAIGFGEDTIGSYIDRNGKEQRVLRESVYGVQIVDAMNKYYATKWGCKG